MSWWNSQVVFVDRYAENSQDVYVYVVLGGVQFVQISNIQAYEN